MFFFLKGTGVKQDASEEKSFVSMILSSFVKLSVLILCYPADSPLSISFSRSPLLSRSSPTQSFLGKEESPAWDSFQPLLPEICLNHVWQETQIPVRYSSAFVCDNALPSSS